MLLRMRRVQAIVVAAAVSVFLVAAGFLVLVRPAGATMAASSEAPGHAASRAAPGVAGSWRPRGNPARAWLQMDWERPQDIDSVTVRPDAPPESGKKELAGYLRFSDGSRLWVRSSGKSAISITPRTVSWVRFTLVETPGDSGGDGLAEFNASSGGGPSGSVDSEAPRDGDVAGSAELSGADSDLVDGQQRTGSEVDDVVELTWSRPRELARVSIGGVPEGATLARATLVFSDGSRVPVGGVTSDATRPTTVAFMPRSTTSLRLVIDSTSRGGDLTLSELSAFVVGADPQRPVSNPESALGPPTSQIPCTNLDARPDDDVGVVVICPSNGSVVGGRVSLQLAAGPSFKSVTAERLGGQAEFAAPAELDATGQGTVDLDVSGVAPGPFTVKVQALGGSRADVTAYLQLVRPGVPDAGNDTMAPTGRSLVFEDEFNSPPSVNRLGENADYVAGKPESWGVNDFGGAIFADPTRGHGNLAQSDGYLELVASPRPPDVTDPSGWGREHLGAMLASARTGGSGFSAQFGYFEARMLAPANPGTWPAFWMLSNPNLVEPEDTYAEVDAVELYGHDPVGACQTTHQYPDPDGVGEALCGNRWRSDGEALQWHTYGVDIRPDRIVYTIDGQVVGSAPQVAAADEPMFWMVDLALGGGWPVELASLRDRASLYVDWVRAYV